MQKNTKMKSSLRITSQIILVLIVASILAPFADAFRSSTTATSPIVAPLDVPAERKRQLPRAQPNEATEKSSPNKILVEKMTIEKRKFKYDLGLGKNSIVKNGRADGKPSADQDLDPTRFLIEHESVRSYPSPLNSDSESQSRNNNRTNSNRKKLPKVQHRRHSEDVLCIVDQDYCNDDNFDHPVIVPINHCSTGSNGPAAKFDVNTVWVEMMIHNEQKKAAH